MKCSPGKAFLPGIVFMMAVCLLSSCKQRSQQGQMDESAFVFGKEYIDGDAADYKGLPLRVVNFYLDDGTRYGICSSGN